MVNDLLLYAKIYPDLIRFENLTKFFCYPLKGITTYPLSINFLITSDCNFRCQMCSFYGLEQKEKERELNLDEIISFVKKVSKYKPIIFLGGGEPFLRRDIYEIIAGIKKFNLICLISTNGYLLDLERLQNLNLDGIIISLYGPEEIHNKITRVKDAYQVTTMKIKELVKFQNLRNLILSITIMPENIPYLDTFVEVLLEFKIDKIKIENLNYITEEEFMHSQFGEEKFDLTPFTLIRKNNLALPEVDLAWQKIYPILKKYKGRVYLKPNLSKQEFFNWYLGKNKTDIKCFFLKHSIFVSPGGEVLPCQFLRNYRLGNIKKDDIIYIWNSEKYRNIRKFIDKANLSICKRCCK